MEPLSTACPPLDRLLAGGLEADAITLVFGEGGSGKTNLALQCARTAAMAGKRVAYVDTEGVSSTRLQQVFEEAPAAADQLLFYQPYTFEEQERLVRNAALAPDLGLVVVDSINMHYRLHMETGGEKEASQSLLRQLHGLTTFARQKQVPVLITGQVYGGEDATQPFARRTMEHLVKALVRFEKMPDAVRRATILKHRSIPEGASARFRIGAHGLEGPRGSSGERAPVTTEADASAADAEAPGAAPIPVAAAPPVDSLVREAQERPAPDPPSETQAAPAADGPGPTQDEVDEVPDFGYGVEELPDGAMTEDASASGRSERPAQHAEDGRKARQDPDALPGFVGADEI